VAKDPSDRRTGELDLRVEEFRRHWMSAYELARLCQVPESKIKRLILRGRIRGCWRDPVTRLWWLPRTLRGGPAR
jgi:hypothetical protein